MTPHCSVFRLLSGLIFGWIGFIQIHSQDTPLRVGVFVVDATPPLDTPLAYTNCDAIGMPLTARGIVLLGNDAPVVLCAVDWIGISNDGQKEWRKALAEAVNTTPDRVTVHTLHQHDAPRCDFSVESMMAEQDLAGIMFDATFARQTILRTAKAAAEAASNAQKITHLGLGQARVEKVASTRRIMGPDGKVKAVRYTACKDPALRAEPEGTIDPMVKSMSFWNEDKPVVVLTWYATHPQSYYLTGIAHPDFPGMARYLRETTLNGIPHVHFTGAGGNVGAGKYNDGSPENRQVLAVRLAAGMSKALTETVKTPVKASDLQWTSQKVALPVAKHLNETELLNQLKDPTADPQQLTYVAKDLIWLRRCKAGEQLDIHCLTLNDASVLFMPGELAVEYQLKAQAMQPDRFVAMAAYGEYAMGYICTKDQYGQGGYEDSPRASKVAPEVEDVLLPAMKRLLGKP